MAEIVEDTVVDFGGGLRVGIIGQPARRDSEEVGGSAADGGSDDDVEVVGAVPALETLEHVVAGLSTPPGGL